jgi:(S)-ureidoglycine aminohydrolase
MNFAEGYVLLTKEGIRSGRSTNAKYKDTSVYTLAIPTYSSDFYAYLMEMSEKGATPRPIEEENEFFIYSLQGKATLKVDKTSYELSKGDFAYLPPETTHRIQVSTTPCDFFMIKRKYVPAGSERPRFIFGSERDVQEELVPEENRSRKYLVPNQDATYDLGATILTFKPGAGIPSVETHVQHHGILMLSGTFLWYLGHKWYQSKEGDFLWLMPFAPHSVWCVGNSESSCIVYKNWNR